VSWATLIVGRSLAVEASQRGGYLFRLDRPGWIPLIAYQPLEFNAHPRWRPGLEADPVNVSLGVSLREPCPLCHDFNTT
jgi:hypothetical protein